MITEKTSNEKGFSESMFSDQKFKMDENMRTTILDEVRKAIEAKKTDIQSSEILKKTIEDKYGGKWQIFIGKDLSIYFDETIISEYLTLQIGIKTMIIFRKKSNGQFSLSKNQINSPMRESIKKKESKIKSLKDI